MFLQNIFATIPVGSIIVPWYTNILYYNNNNYAFFSFLYFFICIGSCYYVVLRLQFIIDISKTTHDISI